MKLKEGLQPVQFLQEAARCAGDVWMCSGDGDRLNLKSQLSRFLFVSAAMQGDLLRRCWVECELARDAALLAPLWQDERSGT